ncbi:hypothetical protein ON010_g5463 [Phytophthora cinnamomi]|nr:hypothetical protein ON010_g5463 [Phytophthora cinnamomi]
MATSLEPTHALNSQNGGRRGSADASVLADAVSGAPRPIHAAPARLSSVETARSGARVAAACRVGSVFYERIFWTRWREFVAERRQERQGARENEMKKLEEGEELPGPDEKSTNNADVAEKADAIVSASDGEENREEGAAVLKTKKHYLKRWELGVEHDKKNAEIGNSVIVRIRSMHAIRRWRRFVRTKKDADVLQQRAYFFLYYWLLKRSLNQLGRHAQVKRRDRQLTVTIVKASRQRLLVKSMQRWRLRLRLHQTLVLWRGYVRRRRHQTLLYRPIAEALTRKTRRCILQHTFDIWEKQHARIRAQRMLLRVIDRHLYQKVCKRAWTTWKIKVRQLARLDTFHRRSQEFRLRRIWGAWSARAGEKEYREQQRRRAVRHYYLSLLRKGLNGFRAWRMQGQLRLSRVETMLNAADARIIAFAFARWDHFTSIKKGQALKYNRALLHSQSQQLKRIWTKGFLCFFTKARSKKRMLLAANEKYYTRSVGRCFRTWKDMWQAERNREDMLSKMLHGYMVTKGRIIEAEVLEYWSEFTRAKAAARVVNAQVRGYAQRRTLQKYFSQWITYVSILRWQQITLARAKQHHKAVLFRKCFDRWRHNVLVRQRYRKKTRIALIHWKLTLERKVFDGWKQYLENKRNKHQRIHEALEFRHEQFIRDGLRNWMTAAMHLQEQREQRVTILQACNTTNVWRRVAAIARHWRYLAIRRRALRDQGEFPDIPRDAPRRFQDMYRASEHPPTVHAQAIKTAVLARGIKSNLRHAGVFPNDSESSNWTNEPSPLSEFVLLPRNRPQPRRPVDIMLFAESKTKSLGRGKDNTITHEALRCGFDFPDERFAPLSPPPQNQVPQAKKKLPSAATSTGGHSKFCGLSPTSGVPPREGGDLILPSSTLSQLDALERQLLALSQRKRDWTAFQQQLNTLRGEVNTHPRLLAKLKAMEEQHTVRTKQWLHTKERIRSVATEIRHLRNALQR